MPSTPNRDWAWDQFDLDINQGELDILNDRELENLDLTRSQEVNYETRFIDDLYGTDNAQWTGEGLPYDYGSPSGAEGALRTAARYQSSYLAVDTTLWGLDLRRVYNEDLEIGSQEHYEHITRGEVDWASYEDDNAYQAAFDRLKDEDSFSTYGNPNDISFLTDDDFTDQQRVEFIRDANINLGQVEEDTDDYWDVPTDFDNKYEPKYHHDGPNQGQPIDPDSVIPYEASNLFDPSSETIQSRLVGADGQRMTIRRDVAETSVAGSPRDVAGTAQRAGIRIRRINPRRPSGVPQAWGPIE